MYTTVQYKHVDFVYLSQCFWMKLEKIVQSGHSAIKQFQGLLLANMWCTNNETGFISNQRRKLSGAKRGKLANNKKKIEK